jgi:hypothetical protein
MAVVIPIRFASADPGRRDRIVGTLRANGIDVRRSDVQGLGPGELYLLRAHAGPTAPRPRSARGLAARGMITDLLERHVPGWQAEAEFYWPE